MSRGSCHNAIPHLRNHAFGTGENLALLEEFLQRRKAVLGNRQILLSALCLVLSDTSSDVDDPGDPEFSSKVSDILKRKIGASDELKDDSLYDAIEDLVYPVIGRPNNELALPRRQSTAAFCSLLDQSGNGRSEGVTRQEEEPRRVSQERKWDTSACKTQQSLFCDPIVRHEGCLRDAGPQARVASHDENNQN